MTKNGKLSAKTQAWCDRIEQEFELGPADALLLQLAGEAFDGTRAARQAIIRDGAYLRSSRGALVAHPALKAELDAAKTFAALAKQLNLGDLSDPDRYAATARRRR
jgi:phage terminase small subunit